MDINTAFKIIDEVLSKLALSRPDHDTLKQALRLLYYEATENQERKNEDMKEDIKKEEKDFEAVRKLQYEAKKAAAKE